MREGLVFRLPGERERPGQFPFLFLSLADSLGKEKEDEWNNHVNADYGSGRGVYVNPCAAARGLATLRGRCFAAERLQHLPRIYF